MLSKRLKAIADLVPLNAKVIDIGTDHAYLPIYLYLNDITKDITATDISQNVLDGSLNNLEKYGLKEKIKLIKSDGFKNVFETYDLAIIAGMGTRTIIDILKIKQLPKELIIQSNNELNVLREFMNKLDYKIVSEVAVKEKNIYYSIIYYKKGKEKLAKQEILFGKSNNLEYYKFLYDKYENLYKKSKQMIYLDYKKVLNEIIGKIQD